jgi:hypothetical protein
MGKPAQGFSNSNRGSTWNLIPGREILSTVFGRSAITQTLSAQWKPMPDSETLRQDIFTTQHALETRAAMKGPDHG